MKLSELDITYPSSLSQSEKDFIFECFRNEYGSEVEEWIKIEKGTVYKGEDALDGISNSFREYIVRNTKSTSTMAVSSLFMDMRSIIHKKF